MQQPRFVIRAATEADCDAILGFIRALARYEKLEDQVRATVESLRESLFVRRQAEVLMGEEDGVPVAFALFFHNYSTFLGKAGLYLEDLYVDPAVRGRGYGQAMLRRLAAIAVERNCERLDWWCLDWNRDAQDFYRRMGAMPMEDWTVWRMERKALLAAAESSQEFAEDFF